MCYLLTDTNTDSKTRSLEHPVRCLDIVTVTITVTVRAVSYSCDVLILYQKVKHGETVELYQVKSF